MRGGAWNWLKTDPWALEFFALYAYKFTALGKGGSPLDCKGSVEVIQSTMRTYAAKNGAPLWFAFILGCIVNGRVRSWGLNVAARECLETLATDTALLERVITYTTTTPSWLASSALFEAAGATGADTNLRAVAEAVSRFETRPDYMSILADHGILGDVLDHVILQCEHIRTSRIIHTSRIMYIELTAGARLRHLQQPTWALGNLKCVSRAMLAECARRS